MKNSHCFHFFDFTENHVMKNLNANRGHIQIPPGTLAAEEDSNAVRKAQERIRRMLLEGQPIPVGPSGDVSGTTREAPVIQVQPGKLAAIQQWYQREPQRLELETQLMRQTFPQFQRTTLRDGRLAWSGFLSPNLWERGFQWHLLAVYNNDHPQAVMGSSVRIFLIKPSFEELVQTLQWTPSHVIPDPIDGYYLCTTRAEDVQCGLGNYETTAVQSLAWANKWLCAMELVFAGKLSKKKFNEHGII